MITKKEAINEIIDGVIDLRNSTRKLLISAESIEKQNSYIFLKKKREICLGEIWKSLENLKCDLMKDANEKLN